MSSLRKSAEQGNADAQYALGGMYEFGLGVAKDAAAAVMWYRRAVVHGNEKAKDSLDRLQGTKHLSPKLHLE